jgi:hypothetical protein
LALTNARVGARDDANARHRRALVVTARLNIVVSPSSVVECGRRARVAFTPTDGYAAATPVDRSRRLSAVLQHRSTV